MILELKSLHQTSQEKPGQRQEEHHAQQLKPNINKMMPGTLLLQIDKQILDKKPLTNREEFVKLEMIKSEEVSDQQETHMDGECKFPLLETQRTLTKKKLIHLKKFLKLPKPKELMKEHQMLMLKQPKINMKLKLKTKRMELELREEFRQMADLIIKTL